jgi:hypothetical protein
MRGIALGMRALKEFEIGLPQISSNTTVKEKQVVKTKKKKNNVKWTEEEESKLYDTSLTAGQLAKILGRSSLTIYTRRSKLGIKVRELKKEAKSNIAKLNQ